MTEVTENITEQIDLGNTEKSVADDSNIEMETENLKEELKKAKIEIESLKDSWARERAEFQNFKRRTSQDYLNIKKDTIKSFVAKLLTPLDDLDRASTNTQITEETKPFYEGVNIIKRELFTVLEKENIRKVEPKGELFDPMQMEAIASEESEGFTDERVTEVYQAGYEMTLDNNEKVIIRPSRVKVGRPLN